MEKILPVHVQSGSTREDQNVNMEEFLNTQDVVLKRNVNVIVIMYVTRKNMAGNNLRIVKI